MQHKSYIFKGEDLQWAFIVSCAANVVFTIAKEIMPGVRGILTEVFGNSWFGQLLLMILFFVLLSVAGKLFPEKPSINFSIVLPIALSASVMVLFIFYGYASHG